MQTDPSENLSPFAGDVVRALLASEPATPRERVDDEALVRYACGRTDESEKDRVVLALTRSSDLRGRLIKIRQEVQQIRNAPWATAQEKFKGSAVLACLRDAAGEALRTYQDLGRLLQEGKMDLVATASTGLNRLADWIGSYSAPPLVAVTRGPARLKGDIPGGLSLEAFADGSISASLEFKESDGWNGRDLALYLVDPAGISICLDHARIEDGNWHLTIAGIAAYLGIEPGPVSTAVFNLREVGAKGDDSWIWLPDSKADGVYASFTVSHPPRILAQELILSLKPSADTKARYKGGTIEASLSVEPAELLLGAWPLTDLDTNEEIRAELPDLEFGDAIPPMALRLRVRS